MLAFVGIDVGNAADAPMAAADPQFVEPLQVRGAAIALLTLAGWWWQHGLTALLTHWLVRRHGLTAFLAAFRTASTYCQYSLPHVPAATDGARQGPGRRGRGARA